MSKKDVLMLCQFFYPEVITSAELPFQTAQFIAKNGISIDVLCGYPKEYVHGTDVPSVENVNNVNIKRVKYLQLNRGNKVTRLVNYFSFVVSMFMHLFEMKNYRIIMVYSNPPILPIIALMAKKLFGCEIIFVAYDIYPEIAIRTKTISENGIISTLMKFINDKLYRSAHVVALSNEMKDFILKNRDINEEKISIISNWAMEEGSNREQKNPKFLKESNNEFTISYLGNMGIAQDFITLLETFKFFNENEKSIRLILAGHGNKQDNIRDYIRENNLNNITIYGYLKGEALTEVVNKTDAVFLSLKNEINGLAVPSKYYSYLLMEKPIIAVINKESDIYKDINLYKLGVAVDEQSNIELINRILEIKDGKMKIDTRKIYDEKYSKKIALNKYVILIKEILSK